MRLGSGVYEPRSHPSLLSALKGANYDTAFEASRLTGGQCFGFSFYQPLRPITDIFCVMTPGLQYTKHDKSSKRTPRLRVM